MPSLILPSPAKLNLYLKVINKRPDGFHNIETVFERISLSDEIRLTSNKTGRIRVRCDNPQVPTGPKNLVYKAARLLQSSLNVRSGVDITIKKCIPVAAGLAGGSSNAATVLSGLNRLWRLGLRQKELVSYARQIGSDVAFFLYDTSWALGTGKGDRIKKLSIRTKLWHILVVPRTPMHTPKVYGAMNLKLTKKGQNVNILIRHLSNGGVPEIGRLLVNDLETVITRLAPRLLTLKKRLKLLDTQGVMISGSGPSTFGLTTTEQKAREIHKLLSRQFKQVFVVQTL